MVISMVHVAPPPAELKPLVVLAGPLDGIDHEGQPRRSTNPIDRLETLGTVMCTRIMGKFKC